MKDTRSDRDRLQRLFDSFGEISLEYRGMADDILEDAGLDRAQLAKEGAALARKLYGEARLRAAGTERVEAERRLAELRERVRERLRATSGDPIKSLARLLVGENHAAYQIQFRKLSEVNAEDALDILTESELLKALGETDDSDADE